MSSEEKMPFTQHLEELRKRIIICIAAVTIGFLVSYGFKETIFGWLMRPMIDALPEGPTRKLIYTGPVEALLTYLKVSFIGGIGLATPVILYQFWRFVAPGLYAHERKYLYPVLISSTVFFVGGSLFGYYVVFPYGFQFFTSFANEFITPMISTREFLSFATKMLLAFGMMFELPLVTFIFAKIGIINNTFLRKQRKYAIVIIFIVAAVLTPTPDAFNQCLMAAPLLVLYELSAWIAYFFGKKEAATEPAQPEEQNESVA
ncbi:MAG TPA: twin-arginine translocase subunit TatC [Syntrophobacteraceae bacterium]|nr:twin-arginine translocase subunit TatC [Syntrophobacteraceae bacterium]HBZ57386.1 twin-arginine translocase subunit TatC [Syntrophobacteraceae bacterium]